MESLTDIAKQIDILRAESDWSSLAEALLHYADALVKAGRMDEAAIALDESTQVHHQLQLTADEAHCSHWAATLYRLTGDFATAQQRAAYAAQLAPAHSPIAVSAATELGETAFAQQQFEPAANYYQQALIHAKPAGLKREMQAELYRKQAIAWSACNHHTKAMSSLDQALELLQTDPGSNHIDLIIRIQIERATLFQQTFEFNEATTIIHTVLPQAKAQQNYLALADIKLMQVSEQLIAKNWGAARKFALSARDYALKDNAAVQYVSAAITLAEIAHQQADYVDAYEALVVGWVTLADLMGDEAARAAFKPKLLELRDRWGASTFQQVKAEYEAIRKSIDSPN